MGKKLIKQTGTVPIQVVVGILAIGAIVGVVIYLYNYWWGSFTPDITEQSQVPPDVQNIENKILSDSTFATSSANPLYEPLTKAKDVKIPTHFRIPTLLYHYVEHVKDRNDTIRISLNIEPEVLDQQIKTMKDAGYTFITPAQIPDLFEGKLILPEKPVILTFDDGYRDFYTDVLPIIKKYNVRVVAYIVSGFLDKTNNLTHKQLKEIRDSGLVEIGAHTVHHVGLKGLDSKRATYEIAQSKEDLGKELGIPIVSFAYPYGSFDLNAIELVKQAKFMTAVSTISGTDVNQDNLFFIYRLRPGKRVGNDLLNFLAIAK